MPKHNGVVLVDYRGYCFLSKAKDCDIEMTIDKLVVRCFVTIKGQSSLRVL